MTTVPDLYVPDQARSPRHDPADYVFPDMPDPAIWSSVSDAMPTDTVPPMRVGIGFHAVRSRYCGVVLIGWPDKPGVVGVGGRQLVAGSIPPVNSIEAVTRRLLRHAARAIDAWQAAKQSTGAQFVTARDLGPVNVTVLSRDTDTNQGRSSWPWKVVAACVEHVKQQTVLLPRFDYVPGYTLPRQGGALRTIEPQALLAEANIEYVRPALHTWEDATTLTYSSDTDDGWPFHHNTPRLATALLAAQLAYCAGDEQRRRAARERVLIFRKPPKAFPYQSGGL